MHVLGPGISPLCRSRPWSICCWSIVLVGVQLSLAWGEQGSATTPRPPVSGDIHPGASHVFIHVGKTGLGHEHAVIGQLQYGQLQLSQPNGAGVLVFDMTSFQADTDDARRYLGFDGQTDASTQEQVNANMLGESVLDVKRYPTATFKVATIQQLPKRDEKGRVQYSLKGDFTLHGVTKPIEVVANMEPKDKWFHVRGSFACLQSDYGITPFSKGFGVIGVADKLTIYADFWVVP
ncbi:YceI family protein [Blastopirellula marina]|uniref:Lipid/polyisoprenoid-binding YceI-like domain-containing protein n=1 Tax=Blastopirellula marina TaxID=124 RepID=A0A2S8GQW7_9BACT|nr:YceI family protein [Blastopirellula marina]PQO46830.1 hypothetical protein C5Y93_06685 [Blastopirellula marina]